MRSLGAGRADAPLFDLIEQLIQLSNVIMPGTAIEASDVRARAHFFVHVCASRGATSMLSARLT